VESTLAGWAGSVDSNVFTGDIIGRIFGNEKRWEWDEGPDRASETIMGDDSMVFDYCQGELLVSTVRMRRAEVQ
jgi:hypothetical protein